MSNHENNGLLLPGLDGSNPLGFLAALGVLRLPGRLLDLKMQWVFHKGRYSPVVSPGFDEPSDLVKIIYDELKKLSRAPWKISKKLPYEYKLFSEEASAAVQSATVSDRYDADVIAGYGAPISNEKDEFEDTELRMVRSGDSAGNGLLAYAERIHTTTSSEDIELALFHDWKFADEKCALRWDPQEDRAYATRWTNPSKESTLSQRGSNRLALEGLACLPVIPGKHHATTTAFTDVGRARKSFTWPLWGHSIGCDVAQSLLRTNLADQEFSEVGPRGIIAVYECHRIMTSQYYANFTPARRIA
ncbi:MAG: hypothetical protein DWQ42_08270 [Planctomycetota bacterium]|nr:MAG: hypothetical protein DWQ42_08270 [Planctomycetota bacterium]REK40308.1 MAG: hypothetical protein DWQ46_16795 [Planctomycetota bacterium]